MINLAILTNLEVMQALNYTALEDMPDKVINLIWPAAEMYLTQATGKDWGTLTTTYTVINPVAKLTAGLLISGWFENPASIGRVTDLGVISMITQLEAVNLKEKAAITT